jgi:hypothetical protein
MMRSATFVLALSVALTPLTLGCRSTRGADASGLPAPFQGALEQGPAVVAGTVVEAATLAPLEGARVVAPDGSEAQSDASGRFEIRGLALGTQGELRATLGELSGSVHLRPVSRGVLEVVLALR